MDFIDRLLNADAVAVDFDGTLCVEAYPGIGAPNWTVILIVRMLKRLGKQLILNTCREGVPLDEAVAWCAARDVKFDTVNENLPERIAYWGGDSRKISADVYLDDRALTVLAGQIYFPEGGGVRGGAQERTNQ